MKITKALFKSMMLSAAETLSENETMISEIDSLSGTGEHGQAIGTVANVMKDHAEHFGKQSFFDFFKSLGNAVTTSCSGMAGAMYGTMLCGMGDGLVGAGPELTAVQLKQMFSSSLQSVQEVMPAQVGDKTVMDALIPAVSAASHAPDNDPCEVLRAAASGAVSGAAASSTLRSKQPKKVPESPYAMGTPDAGAVSAALMLSGFMNGLKQAQYALPSPA